MSAAVANIIAEAETPTTMTPEPNLTEEEARWDQVAQDREQKKELVCDTISKQCRLSAATDPSAYPVVTLIGQALNNNTDSLEIEVLSGGLTNYSYKLHLRSNPSLALFAKISFPYALWNPDPTQYYDVERTAMEYKLMKDLHPHLEKDVVAAPFFCFDIPTVNNSKDACDDSSNSSPPECKLLVTEWCTADEQWSHQLIEGRVDMRIAPKVGRALGTLHCLPVEDTNHNTKAARSDCMKSAFDFMETSMNDMVTQDDVSSMFPTLQTSARSYQYAKKLTVSGSYAALIEKSRRNYLDDRECLIHSDSHVFNILVEDQKSGGDSMTLCDWEMAFVGPLGRDNGYFQAFPISCAVGHALTGNIAASHQVLEVVENVRQAYEDTLRTSGRTEEDIRYAFQQTLGWTGWMGYFSNYLLTLHSDVMPFFDETSNERELHRDACGVMFLRMMELGFGDKKTCDELKTAFQCIITDELDRCTDNNQKMAQASRRKSSLVAFRRLSDTVLQCAVVAAASAELPYFQDDN